MVWAKTGIFGELRAFERTDSPALAAIDTDLRLRAEFEMWALDPALPGYHPTARRLTSSDVPLFGSERHALPHSAVCSKRRVPKTKRRHTAAALSR